MSSSRIFFALLLPLTLQAAPDPALSKRFAELAAPAKGKVAVMATVLETGETASLNGSDHVPMQSVYKLPIAMAMLRLVEAGKFQLEQPITLRAAELAPKGSRSPLRDAYPNGFTVSLRELMEYAVSESDNTACDWLIHLAGGASRIEAQIRAIGVENMKIRYTEQEMAGEESAQYSNWTTAEGSIQLLRTLQEGKALNRDHTQLVLSWLVGCTTGPNRLKGGLTPGVVLAHKTGTSATVRGVTAATNDIGIITLASGKHLAIAVYVTESPASEPIRESVIAALAKAAYEQWGAR